MLTKTDKIKLSVLGFYVLAITVLCIWNATNNGIHPGV
jgi:hypothetical protein